MHRMIGFALLCLCLAPATAQLCEPVPECVVNMTLPLGYQCRELTTLTRSGAPETVLDNEGLLYWFGLEQVGIGDPTPAIYRSDGEGIAQLFTYLHAPCGGGLGISQSVQVTGFQFDPVAGRLLVWLLVTCEDESTCLCDEVNCCPSPDPDSCFAGSYVVAIEGFPTLGEILSADAGEDDDSSSDSD